MAERGGDGFERPSSQPKLARALDFAVAGEDLFDEGRPRAWETEDENRPAGLQAARPIRFEKRGVESADEADRESFMIGGIVDDAAGLLVFKRQCVGLLKTTRGTRIVSERVVYLRRREQEPGAWMRAQVGIGDPLLEGFELYGRELALQVSREPGEGQRVVGLQTEGLAIRRLGIVRPPLFFEHDAEVLMNGGPVGLQAFGDAVLFHRLIEPPILLQRPAEIEVGRDLFLWRKRENTLPARDCLVGIVAFAVELGP